MSSGRRSFYILLPVLSALVALLLAELLLALFYPIPYSLEVNMYFEPDPYTGFRNKPLSRGTYPSGIEAMANSRGHRDDEVSVPKDQDVFRILLVGDSFTVGANVEQAEVYGQVLEDLLNEGAGKPVEVVNTGVGGWSPFQYAQYLEHYGAEFAPDLVLVGLFVGNDLFIDRFAIEQTLTAVLGRRVSREAALDRTIRLKVFAYEHSHLFRALTSAAPENINFNRTDCGDFGDGYYTEVQKKRLSTHLSRPAADDLKLLDRNVAELGRMRAQAEELGAAFVVVVFPDENQINPLLQTEVISPGEESRYDFDMPQKVLHERLDEAGIVWVDMLDTIRSDSRCLFMNDTHWVPAGHALVAEQVRGFLQAQRLVP